MIWEWDKKGSNGLVYGFSTNMVKVRKESWAFPPLSFLAEVGGSLGLFIGFSFLGLYDNLVDMFRILRPKIIHIK